MSNDWRRDMLATLLQVERAIAEAKSVTPIGREGRNNKRSAHPAEAPLRRVRERIATLRSWIGEAVDNHAC